MLPAVYRNSLHYPLKLIRISLRGLLFIICDKRVFSKGLRRGVLESVCGKGVLSSHKDDDPSSFSRDGSWSLWGRSFEGLPGRLVLSLQGDDGPFSVFERGSCSACRRSITA